MVKRSKRPAFQPLTWALAIGAFGVLAYYLAIELSSLRLEEPMSLWETVYVSLAGAWPHGYQPGFFVAGHDNYGPGYPALGWILHLVVPDVYLADRIANLIVIAGSMGVIGWVLRKGGSGRLTIFALLALYYGIWAGTYSIQARPDFLLAFLIILLLAVGAPVAGLRPMPRAVLIGLLAAAAYLTKPYALAIWGAVISADFILGAWRRGIITAAVSGLILAASIAGYAAANPYYLLETFQAHLAHESFSFDWFLHQAGDFAGLAAGLVVGAVAIVIPARKTLVRWGATEPENERLRYWGWTLLVGIAAVAAGPGWHEGAYLTYHLHLILPALVIFVGLGVNRLSGGTLRITQLAFLANCAILLWFAPDPPQIDHGWNDLKADLAAQPGKVVADFIMEPLARARPNTFLASTGLTGFAIEEPTLIPSNGTAVRMARAESLAFAKAKEKELFDPLPAALYLDCVIHSTGTGFVVSPRTNVSYLPFLDYGYRIVGSFNLHPYYFATNERRQKAGQWTTTILKMVRIAQPPAKP